MLFDRLNSSTSKLLVWMQFEEEEGAVAVATATDDDNEVRQTSSFEAQGFSSPYLEI
jgi:hypothetical protein